MKREVERRGRVQRIPEFKLMLPQNKQQQNAEGLYVLTLKYPDLFPVMESAQIPETRKAMNEAYAKMLNEENTPLLEKILLLRRGLLTSPLYYKSSSFLLFTM